MPKSVKNTEQLDKMVRSLNDRDPPSLDVIVVYLVSRCIEERKTKDDLILMVRKAWDEMPG